MIRGLSFTFVCSLSLTHAVIAAPCAGSTDRVIHDETYTAPAVITACQDISAGPEVVIDPGGDVAFRAGRSVALNGRFTVRWGGEFAIVIDPVLTGDILSRSEAAGFLARATFGPTPATINALAGASASEWLLEQLTTPATYHLPYVRARIDESLDNIYGWSEKNLAINSFWIAAITGEDQIRQRMAYALSQLVVTSGNVDASVLWSKPHTQAHYMDILVSNAFGNYRELLEDITYSPAMGQYLTYAGSLKGNPDTGSVPDENYARELMQLFTIGVVMLNQDGTVKLFGGEPVPTYTNEDITGLARVFTGLDLKADSIFANDFAPDANYTRMKIYPYWHSAREKSFLGTTIPAGTSAAVSIDMALDTLFNHPNVAPFISRQLIQRFVTSDPEPDYVARVANAFESGTYILPNGVAVGDGRRGSLRATIAAILFDPAARLPAARNAPGFGKLREPVLRFTHWARAFDVADADTSDIWIMLHPDVYTLKQKPFNPLSVFNFYRPGYVPPGTEAGALDMTVPELQIVTSVSIVGYTNFMAQFIFREVDDANEGAPATYQPDYSDETALADNPRSLVEHLDVLLANGRMSDTTKDRVVNIIAGLPVAAATREEDLERRAELAVLLIMTSPEYLIQR